MSYIQALLFNKKGKKLSDIEYLAIKEFGGKLRHDDGTQPSSTTGDLGTLTANTGKDMYLAKAKVSVVAASSGTGMNVEIELVINGTVRETFVATTKSTTQIAASGVMSQGFEFALTGIKVAAGEIMKLEVTTNSGAICWGTIECWEEDTGASPAV